MSACNISRIIYSSDPGKNLTEYPQKIPTPIVLRAFSHLIPLRVHGVHDEKRVWFEVELQGAQWDREAEVFMVSNNDTAVAQRWSEDKQPEEKTNTNCLVKEHEKEYQTGWKIKTGNVLDSCNQRSTQQCIKSEVAKHLGIAGIQQQNRLVDEKNVTLFAKVRCFLIQSGLSKVFWAKDTTRSTYLVNRSPSSVIGFKKPIDMLGGFWLALLYKNIVFNESGEYKKTFIGSGVGTSSMQVLHRFKFKVEPLGDHTFERRHNEAAFAVSIVDKIFAHESLTFNGKAVTTATTITGSMHQGLLVKAKGNVLGLEIIRDQGVGSQEYQVVCTRPDITSTGVDMLDGFDRGLQINVQVFVDFNYAMRRSVTVMSRSITGYGLMILGCARSLKANLQHMEALSTTEAGYLTFTEAWKKEIWLKGLLTELGYELRLVAGIATGALIKGCSRSEVPA
ncbi:zinc finger, CCHC-type containing protein [Tanacetum coccineum]